jgi:uncharacterized PurR-regulated membrane protein YhhQ (DUF165 family)
VTTYPRTTTAAVLAAVVFLLSIVGANALTARYGLVPVGLGLYATAGTYAAAAALSVRDVLHDAGGARLVLFLIVVGAGLSWVLSTPALALASGAAFALSETADMLVYTPLRQRGYVRAALASNVVGAVVDTAVFLWLAAPTLKVFNPHFTVAGSLPGQLWAKVWISSAVVGLVWVVRRAVPRQPVS